MVRRQAMTRPRTPAATCRTMQEPHTVHELGWPRRLLRDATKSEQMDGTLASARPLTLGLEAGAARMLMVLVPMMFVTLPAMTVFL
jgi:hypothetical protein